MSVPPARIGEITVSALILNLVAIPVTLIVTGITVVVAFALPHRIPMGSLEPLWMLLGLVVLFTLHELLHALALKMSDDLPWKEFKFGFSWRMLVLYCHCRRPVTINAFRRCALAPLIVIGSATLLATLAYPAFWLSLLTGVHLSGCIGDVWVYVRSRKYPKHFLFLDYRDKIGGEVFEPAQELAPRANLTTA